MWLPAKSRRASGIAGKMATNFFEDGDGRSMFGRGRRPLTQVVKQVAQVAMAGSQLAAVVEIVGNVGDQLLVDGDGRPVFGFRRRRPPQMV